MSDQDEEGGNNSDNDSVSGSEIDASEQGIPEERVNDQGDDEMCLKAVPATTRPCLEAVTATTTTTNPCLKAVPVTARRTNPVVGDYIGARELAFLFMMLVDFWPEHLDHLFIIVPICFLSRQAD
jgi:hypothetical protein